MPTNLLGEVTRKNDGKPQAFLAALKKPGLHGDGGKLFLLVSETLNASYIFRYRDATATPVLLMKGPRAGLTVMRKQEHWIGLGSTSEIDLPCVRKKAQKLREAMEGSNGDEPVDPKTARASLKPMPTFSKLLDEYFETHSYDASWRSMIDNHATPTLGAMPVDQITDVHVMLFLKPLWNTTTKTAQRLRQRLEQIFDAAIGWKYCKINPAPRRLLKLLPKVKKITKVESMSSMPWHEVPAFVRRLREIETTVALALEFVILTVVRSGSITGDKRKNREEVPAIMWDDIDFEQRVWTVGKTKTGLVDFCVHLSDRAIAILEIMKTKRRPGVPFVFPSTQQPNAKMGKNAMLDLLNKMTGSTFDVHGFRSSFRTWCDEKESGKADDEIAEAIMSHELPGNDVEVAYRRGDLLDVRTPLYDEWAAFVDGRVEMKSARERRLAKLALVA